jgi:flagellar assembly protein FliH
MSSKVVLPGDEGTVRRLVWRRAGAEAMARTASETAPDLATQMAQLETERQHQVREAHATGVREGEIAGRNRAGADLQPVMERLTRAIQELAGMRARLRQEAESDVVQLALAIARRVIRRETAADPDALRGLVMAALEKLQGQEISRVKVHPSHVAMVKSCLDQTAGGSPVEVLADASCELGSAVFETTRGNLDASVDSQLQEIERGLTDRLRKKS